VSLSSRRGLRGESGPDDAKSSIVGLSGWLFADLLLALAVVFLVASDRPAESSIGDKDDVYDLQIEFLESPTGKAVTKIEQIDQPFDVWLRLSEPIQAETLDLSDITVSPDGQWTYQFVDKPDAGATQVVQLKLAPLDVLSTSLELAVEKRAAQHISRENSWSESASLEITVTLCRALTGIAVLPEETARFVIKGGQRMTESDLKKWFENPDRRLIGTDLSSPKDEGFGNATLIYVELQKPADERRQVGFAILFGGYVKDRENADLGTGRAEERKENVRSALRELSLLPRLDTGTAGGQCPRAAEVPVRPFGDSSIGVGDLKFELYFYNEK
jgi:hypothetical protein